MSVYVGIDVHRKRSQVAVVTEDGTVQLNKNVVNGSEPMLRLIGGLPPGTPVAFEAAFGWGWLAELLEDYGFEAHLVHPLRCKAIASARLKNDKVDAAILAQLLRADLLPEAWIAPPAVRQLRALLRHRAGLVRLRTQQQNRIHAVVADFGYDRSGSYLSGPGRGWLAGLELPAVSRDPTVRGSDLTVRHGHISKQGSAWLRWVMNQAAQTAKRSPEFSATYAAIAQRRGEKIATIAISRKLLTRAWHLLATTAQAPGPAAPDASTATAAHPRPGGSPSPG